MTERTPQVIVIDDNPEVLWAAREDLPLLLQTDLDIHTVQAYSPDDAIRQLEPKTIQSDATFVVDGNLSKEKRDCQDAEIVLEALRRLYPKSTRIVFTGEKHTRFQVQPGEYLVEGKDFVKLSRVITSTRQALLGSSE